jgi:hypothetical protein
MTKKGAQIIEIREMIGETGLSWNGRRTEDTGDRREDQPREQEERDGPGCGERDAHGKGVFDGPWVVSVGSGGGREDE